MVRGRKLCHTGSLTRSICDSAHAKPMIAGRHYSMLEGVVIMLHCKMDEDFLFKIYMLRAKLYFIKENTGIRTNRA